MVQGRARVVRDERGGGSANGFSQRRDEAARGQRAQGRPRRAAARRRAAWRRLGRGSARGGEGTDVDDESSAPLLWPGAAACSRARANAQA